MSRIGVLGGTFDPVHRGHLAMARAAERALSLQRICFVPASTPWHRSGPPGASYADRFAMLALALEGKPRWQPLAVPDLAGRPTYTLDQLRWMRRQGLGPDLVFILGADSFATLPSWHRWRTLLASCDWLVLARGGQTWEDVRTVVPRNMTAEVTARGARLRAGARIHWLARFADPSSGHDTRRRMARAAAAPVPASVARYARRAGLYQPHG